MLRSRKVNNVKILFTFTDLVRVETNGKIQKGTEEGQDSEIECLKIIVGL